MLFVDELPLNVKEAMKEIKEELWYTKQYEQDVKRIYTVHSIDEKYSFIWILEINYKDKTSKFTIKLKADNNG